MRGIGNEEPIKTNHSTPISKVDKVRNQRKKREKPGISFLLLLSRYLSSNILPPLCFITTPP